MIIYIPMNLVRFSATKQNLVNYVRQSKISIFGVIMTAKSGSNWLIDIDIYPPIRLEVWIGGGGGWQNHWFLKVFEIFSKICNYVKFLKFLKKNQKIDINQEISRMLKFWLLCVQPHSKVLLKRADNLFQLINFK